MTETTLAQSASGSADIIDSLCQITPGSHLDTIRRSRAQARENAQRSFEVLLDPQDPGTFPLSERYAVAAYTVGLQASDSAALAFYLELTEEETDSHFARSIEQLASAARRAGPYGEYREPRHAEESEPGETVHYDPEDVPGSSPRLAAALEHAHLLSLHPRDARPEHLKRLENAGWSADDIVTLSQLISFLAFQIRVVDGLLALADNPAPQEAR